MALAEDARRDNAERLNHTAFNTVIQEKERIPMTISEKVAYTKGLFDGMELDTAASKEAKLIASILDILEEVGLSIEDLEDTCDTLGEEIDVLSDDLSDVEDVVFEDEDDEDEDEDEDDDFFEVECPNCGADICIDGSVLEAGEVACPACDEKFAIDLADECDCGCGCEE